MELRLVWKPKIGNQSKGAKKIKVRKLRKGNPSRETGQNESGGMELTLVWKPKIGNQSKETEEGELMRAWWDGVSIRNLNSSTHELFLTTGLVSSGPG